ncbi:MAG: hypothetical protein QOE03_3895 [Micromonosporaceae bacterium]|jgi:hypothetical protein|nr:hypothetical protein [Micromonosporaceae bacterium]
MVTNLEDATYAFLLRSVTPLVVAPPGSLPAYRTTLRGVVRASNDVARIVVSNDVQMTSGLAVEFALSREGEALDVEAAIDCARTAPMLDNDQFREKQSQPFDSHGNVIVDASLLGFSDTAQTVSYDHALFRLFGLLTHGGGFPRFEDVYTFAGFMLRAGNKCRIYIRVTGNGQVYGVEIPLTSTAGKITRSFGGSLPQELVPLVREGDLLIQPRINDPDDYCVAVFDMTTWVDPTSAST